MATQDELSSDTPRVSWDLSPRRCFSPGSVSLPGLLWWLDKILLRVGPLHGTSSIPHVLTRCVRQELGFSHLGGGAVFPALVPQERLLRSSRELKAIGLVMRYFQQQCWQTFDRMSLPKEGGRSLYPSHNREAQVFLRWAEGTGLSLNPSPSWGIRVWRRTLCPGPSRSLEQSSHSVWTSSSTFCRLTCDGFLFATSLPHSFRYTVLLFRIRRSQDKRLCGTGTSSSC